MVVNSQLLRELERDIFKDLGDDNNKITQYRSYMSQKCVEWKKILQNKGVPQQQINNILRVFDPITSEAVVKGCSVGLVFKDDVFKKLDDIFKNATDLENFEAKFKSKDDVKKITHALNCFSFIGGNANIIQKIKEIPTSSKEDEDLKKEYIKHLQSTFDSTVLGFILGIQNPEKSNFAKSNSGLSYTLFLSRHAAGDMISKTSWKNSKATLLADENRDTPAKSLSLGISYQCYQSLRQMLGFDCNCEQPKKDIYGNIALNRKPVKELLSAINFMYLAEIKNFMITSINNLPLNKETRERKLREVNEELFNLDQKLSPYGLNVLGSSPYNLSSDGLVVPASPRLSKKI